MRVITIIPFALCIALSACSVAPTNSEFYGMTERTRIDAQAQTDAAAIQATAAANSAALTAQTESQRIAAQATAEAYTASVQATTTANTNAANVEVAQIDAEADIAHDELWSGATTIIVLVLSVGLVIGVFAYWHGRVRIAVIESGARIQIAQIDHNAAMALLEAGPRGDESPVPMDAYQRHYGKNYIVRYGEQSPWFGATERGLVKLIVPKRAY